MLTVLQLVASPSRTARERILAEKDLEQLKRWFEKAVLASSIAEVIEEAVASARI